MQRLFSTRCSGERIFRQKSSSNADTVTVTQRPLGMFTTPCFYSRNPSPSLGIRNTRHTLLSISRPTTDTLTLMVESGSLVRQLPPAGGAQFTFGKEKNGLGDI